MASRSGIWKLKDTICSKGTKEIEKGRGMNTSWYLLLSSSERNLHDAFQKQNCRFFKDVWNNCDWYFVLKCIERQNLPDTVLDPPFSSPFLYFASSSQFLDFLILHFCLPSKTIKSKQNQSKSIFCKPIYNQPVNSFCFSPSYLLHWYHIFKT